MSSIIKDQHGTFLSEVFFSHCATHFVKEIDYLLAVDRDATIEDLRELSTVRFYFVHWHILPLEGCVRVCVYVYTNV